MEVAELSNPASSPAPSSASNLGKASPTTAPDAAQTSGLDDAMRPRPAEGTPNGNHTTNLAEERGTASLPATTATATPEPVRPASKSPPQGLSPQHPPIQQHLSTQLQSAHPVSTTHPASIAQPKEALPTPHSRPVLSQIHPSHKQHTQTHSSTTPSPSASQAGHPREMSGTSMRFASPDKDHAAVVPKFNRDLSFLADVIQQSCPEAVRRVVRDKWQKCIIGSEFHHAFIMNAVIHHANSTIMRRAVHDFGQTLAIEAKHEIIHHLRPEDLDQVSAAILEKCSDQFLDRALEQRLKTIDARSLINALARAERLGYENGDILEDKKERVMPAVQVHNLETTRVNQAPGTGAQPSPGLSVQVSLPYQVQPTQHPSSPAAELKCRLCWRKFQHTRPYEYHVQKQLCTKAASGTKMHQYWCEDCGAGFTTEANQQYHRSNAVCGSHTTATATPRAPSTTQRAVPSNPTPQSSQIYSTPNQANATPRGTPASTGHEPYRHLSAQKRAELEEELRQAESNYVPRFKEAETIADPVARKAKIESLHNTFSTKQSMIRKKYGVRLRSRRTRAEIDEERSRMGRKRGPSPPGSSAAETPSAKRQRSVESRTTPSNHLSVSQMSNSGLSGSAATAATTDPTAFMPSGQPPPVEQQPPLGSLSSLQRKGYRVSSHVRQADQRTSGSPTLRSGSASAPVVLDDSSGDTDSDEDIPARKVV